MLKHIGLHKDKKIVLLFREVPGEDHMCLVCYSEMLPRLAHDEIMKVVESASGQQAKNLGDALFNTIMQDGSNCLQFLHKSGLIKKVPTNVVKLTPNAKSSVMLDELNKLINNIEAGDKASEKLNKISPIPEKDYVEDSVTVNETALSDSDLATQRIEQAQQMRADAARLLKEAEVLEAEAESLKQPVNVQPKTKTKTKAKKTQPQS